MPPPSCRSRPASGILLILLLARGPLAAETALPGLSACLLAAGGCAVVLAVRAPATALMERRLRFGWIAVAEVLDQVTFFAVAVPLAVSDRPVTGLACGLLLRAVPGALLLITLARPDPAVPRRADLRSSTTFGRPVLVVAALVLIDGLLPLAVLGPDQPRDLGWVNTAASIVGYAAVVMLVMQRVSFAALSDARRRVGVLAQQAQRLAEAATLLLIVMLVPTALAEHWVPALLGSAWNGAGMAFAAMGVGYLLMGPLTVASGVLYAAGRPASVLAAHATMTATYGALLLGGALPHTAAGVAGGYAISRLAGLLATTVLVRTGTVRGSLWLALACAGSAGGGLFLVAWWADGGSGLGALAGGLVVCASATLLAARQWAWLLMQARGVAGRAGPRRVAADTPPRL